MEIVLLITGSLLFFFLVFPFLTVVASFFFKERKVEAARKELDFACVITAYKGNIKLARPLIHSLLQQKHSNNLIYLVEDDCELNPPIEDESVVNLKPENRLSSKVKSFVLAVENFKRKHDAIVIFDPDNVAPPDFLSKLNDYMNAGFKAVQGRRTAKNLETIYACADATGEIYKNYIEREAPYRLGSSPSIAGSGMALDTELFKQYLAWDDIQKLLKNSSVIIEDKMLQNFIVEKGHQTAFAKDAILYDEKVGSGDQTQRQRSRWLYSYFVNVPGALKLIAGGLAGLDMNRLILGLTSIAPPMFILLLSSLLVAAFSLFFSKSVFFLMLSGIIIFIGNIFLTLFLADAPAKIWKSVFGIPLFVYRQFLGLFQMKLSRKEFLVTDNRNAISLQEIERVK